MTQKDRSIATMSLIRYHTTYENDKKKNTQETFDIAMCSYDTSTQKYTMSPSVVSAFSTEISSKCTPIPLLTKSSKFVYIIDLGNVESISVTVRRRQPDHVSDAYIESKYSDLWSNAKWVKAFKDFVDHWQNLNTDDKGNRTGGLLLTYIPPNGRMYPKMVKRVFLSGSVQPKYSVDMVQMTLKFTVGTMLPRASAPFTNVTVYFGYMKDGAFKEIQHITSYTYGSFDVPEHMIDSTHTIVRYDVYSNTQKTEKKATVRVKTRYTITDLEEGETELYFVGSTATRWRTWLFTGRDREKHSGLLAALNSELKAGKPNTSGRYDPVSYLRVTAVGGGGAGGMSTFLNTDGDIRLGTHNHFHVAGGGGAGGTTVFVTAITGTQSVKLQNLSVGYGGKGHSGNVDSMDGKGNDGGKTYVTVTVDHGQYTTPTQVSADGGRGGNNNYHNMNNGGQAGSGGWGLDYNGNSGSNGCAENVEHTLGAHEQRPYHDNFQTSTPKVELSTDGKNYITTHTNDIDMRLNGWEDAGNGHIVSEERYEYVLGYENVDEIKAGLFRSPGRNIGFAATRKGSRFIMGAPGGTPGLFMSIGAIENSSTDKNVLSRQIVRTIGLSYSCGYTLYGGDSNVIPNTTDLPASGGYDSNMQMIICGQGGSTSNFSFQQDRLNGIGGQHRYDEHDKIFGNTPPTLDSQINPEKGQQYLYIYQRCREGSESVSDEDYAKAFTQPRFGGGGCSMWRCSSDREGSKRSGCDGQNGGDGLIVVEVFV